MQLQIQPYYQIQLQIEIPLLIKVHVFKYLPFKHADMFIMYFQLYLSICKFSNTEIQLIPLQIQILEIMYI